MHGGLSSVNNFNLDDIRRIPRGNGFQPEDDDVLVDILWSDPMVIGTGIEENKRGGGILFGADVTASFLNRNNLQCIIRSHTEIREGCSCTHPGCYTVFSAPNKSKNVLGGVLTLHTSESENLRLEGFVFQQSI
ncbi:serine/threonine-protein phosphatase 5 isoform X2 [Eurytemora carolleeae]|uniref:serine/threonine-protein phosphatase 5 isoform X2 n=1 Tax=Eurytemora carolleeae TaxID=1294199 RepID=UPI000C78E01D|nr:serine/threonine-protein phosphatase 5 isoform X2 [Eurytemora carolleeae]|eukprot:XP_023336923.1 serine/threonine-protein phosphatase 5-like isoform X2 [Eurytemora affinis]